MNQEEKLELIRYRIKKARDTFEEVQILIENKLWNTAINRLYYACYYAVIALLINKDLKPQTHSGVRHMFGLHYIKTGLIENDLGKFFTDIYDMRQTGDYDDFIEYSKEDVLDLIEPAQKLVKTAEKVLNQ
jgi:uncharacterized protein (UPF0332 family)